MSSPLSALQSALLFAWSRRETLGLFARGPETECFRVFHGPSEPGAGVSYSFSIDRFGDGYWITEWEGKGPELSAADTDAVVAFLRGKGARLVAILKRPKQGLPNESQIIFGDASGDTTGAAATSYIAHELGLKYAIRMQGVRHPGLFLDHRPLREELLKISRDRRVLNTFCFTGSLSVAAKKGGAREVMSVDLSKPTIEWARENGRLNFGDDASLDYVFGDVFEWLPRFKKKGREFDLVILDPPSFSRGTKGTFSTSKDLVRLHATALSVCANGAWLITSINSAQVSEEDFRRACQAAALEEGCTLELKRRVELPPDFPTVAARPESKYLKGFYFLVSR